MPIHDWTRVDAGTFHDFHQGWTIEIRNALNRGVLPAGYVAAIGSPDEDEAAVQRRNRIIVRHAGGETVAIIEPTAYLEPMTVGTPLPAVPLFLEPGVYVSLPLEATYLAAWDNLGADVRELFGVVE